ncbi:hypothetical protein BDV95DRAFT_600759 [Massariosphaeria phaeospora]|uniref:Uncharacterized protein n=1 Tax=Massariosphaeria phaeospora TaxID=100035 RepID=A0A7C8MVK8_9PLEO|nr:hypothetical protein BDV95DRAFT_600759 [Massariosphaeria phaeospora]
MVVVVMVDGGGTGVGSEELELVDDGVGSNEDTSDDVADGTGKLLGNSDEGVGLADDPLVAGVDAEDGKSLGSGDEASEDDGDTENPGLALGDGIADADELPGEAAGDDVGLGNTPVRLESTPAELGSTPAELGSTPVDVRSGADVGATLGAADDCPDVFGGALESVESKLLDGSVDSGVDTGTEPLDRDGSATVPDDKAGVVETTLLKGRVGGGGEDTSVDSGLPVADDTDGAVGTEGTLATDEAEALPGNEDEDEGSGSDTVNRSLWLVVNALVLGTVWPPEEETALVVTVGARLEPGGVYGVVDTPGGNWNEMLDMGGGVTALDGPGMEGKVADGLCAALDGSGIAGGEGLGSLGGVGIGAELPGREGGLGGELEGEVMGREGGLGGELEGEVMGRLGPTLDGSIDVGAGLEPLGSVDISGGVPGAEGDSGMLNGALSPGIDGDGKIEDGLAPLGTVDVNTGGNVKVLVPGTGGAGDGGPTMLEGLKILDEGTLGGFGIPDEGTLGGFGTPDEGTLDGFGTPGDDTPGSVPVLTLADDSTGGGGGGDGIPLLPNGGAGVTVVTTVDPKTTVEITVVPVNDTVENVGKSDGLTPPGSDDGTVTPGEPVITVVLALGGGVMLSSHLVEPSMTE